MNSFRSQSGAGDPISTAGHNVVTKSKKIKLSNFMVALMKGGCFLDYVFIILTIYAEFIINKLYDISITFYNDFNLILKENRRWQVYLI